jgi:hypothetical protein
MTVPSGWHFGRFGAAQVVSTSAAPEAPSPVSATAESATSVAKDRYLRTFIILLVAVPVLFNAIALLPEIRIPIPSLNDDAFHYLFVQRASQALADGRNPFDVWSPALEIGFPQSLVYQTLPHLFVVFLSRVLLNQASLINLFNLTRYLLMVGFPLTVFWSMRRMGYSALAAAIGAAAASMLSSDGRFGFDYESYVWRGYGMYTQLWAMNLTFVVMACLDYLLVHGKGYVAATVACVLLVVCHLLYTEMMFVTVAVLLLVGITRSNVRARLVRLAFVGALILVISSYFWLPFLRNLPYLNASVYLQGWKYDSFGPKAILDWLVTGQLLDNGRLPILTALLAIGVVAAVLTRTRPARVALVLFTVWLLLYFGRVPWGFVTDRLPAHDLLWYHRFIGGVHLGSILLIGLGGEFLYLKASQIRAIPDRIRLFLAGAATIALLLLVLAPQWGFYDLNRQWMERSQAAIESDHDAATMIHAVQSLPAGRTFAGLRTDWGDSMREGDLHFADLLTFNDIPAVSPPYNSLSLNSDLMWHFDYLNQSQYDLFNVRYVIAPAGQTMPDFLHPILKTSRYTLYAKDTSGYAEFIGTSGSQGVSQQSALFYLNRSWFMSPAPGALSFIHWLYPAPDSFPSGPATLPCPGGGSIRYERALPDEYDFLVDCPQASQLVIKATYHPNWKVTVDGIPWDSHMLSPSLIGVDLLAGEHHIDATYTPPAYPTFLMLLGGGVLIALVCFRKRIERFDADVLNPDQIA